MPDTFERLLPAPGRDTSLTDVFAGRLVVDSRRVAYEMPKEGLAISFGEIASVSKVRVGFPWGVELEFNPRALHISDKDRPELSTNKTIAELEAEIEKSVHRRAEVAKALGFLTALVGLVILVERMPVERSQFVRALVSQLPPIQGQPYIDHLSNDTQVQLHTAEPAVRLNESAATALAREFSDDTSGRHFTAFRRLMLEGLSTTESDSLVEVWEPRSVRFRFTGLRRNEERVDALLTALLGAVAE